MLSHATVSAASEGSSDYSSSSTAELKTHDALADPYQNHILAALPPDDYERIRPDLEPVDLVAGQPVFRYGERAKYLYFLAAGIVSAYHTTDEGAYGEVAVTGREGVVGIESFLGSEIAPTQPMVRSAGHAYRLPAQILRNELTVGGALLYLLLRHLQTLMSQMSRVAVCNCHHLLEQRLCRWLLTYMDRLPTNELAVTHEQIGLMLGVRREGVTEAIGKLQVAGHIVCTRGHITVLHRAALEQASCECYVPVAVATDRIPGAVAKARCLQLFNMVAGGAEAGLRYNPRAIQARLS